MFHAYKSSPQKTTHHVVAVGVFFGFIFWIVVVPAYQMNLTMRPVKLQPWTLNHDWLCLRVGRHRKSLQQCWATGFNQMAGHILFCSSAINLTTHSVRKFPYQGFSKGFSISPFRFFFNRTSSTQPSYYYPMFPGCSMCTNHGKTM